MLPEEEKLNIDFMVWFNLNSFKIYQAIGVGLKKDKTKQNVHHDDSVLKRYYFKDITHRFYLKKKKKKTGIKLLKCFPVIYIFQKIY